MCLLYVLEVLPIFHNVLIIKKDRKTSWRHGSQNSEFFLRDIIIYKLVLVAHKIRIMK